MKKVKNLIGQKFGRLTVVEFSHKSGRSHYWKCVCDCGKEVVRNGGTMRRLKCKSCGCLRKEVLSEVNKTHGMTKSREYSTWRSMRSRCNNPKSAHYQSYGGRGIKICKRWDKFENFYEDMGERPKGYSLDRIDNNKGYNKKNCRWATKKEQDNNRRDNVTITHNGETMTLTEWSRKVNISRITIRGRLKRGWEVGQILGLPPLKEGKASVKYKKK